MSEFPHSHTMKAVCKSSDKEQNRRRPQPRKGLERKKSGLALAAVLEKTKEFFQICDSEGKGYITSTDMRRLHRELPLSADELEDVFDSLDTDRNGYLTLGEFSSGFSDFLHGRRVSEVEDQISGVLPKVPEALYQDEAQSANEDDEESHFSMLMESLGASNVLEDEVRGLWAQLRKDEPHLLYNFEEFLARVTAQIRAAQQEGKEMESALRKKAATHDSEIQRLYEEMEQQMKKEKDQLLLKDSERLQLRSQDLQQQLSSKEQELEQLFLKQRRLEHQYRELHSEQQESRVENIKLKMTNEELSHELENTCQELSLAQEQLAILQEKATRLPQEREMEMYRITEGLQREKQSLMKQLDLLREMNKHLRDERDVSSLVSFFFLIVYLSVYLYVSHRPLIDSVSLQKRNSSLKRLTPNSGQDLVDAPPEGWPLRRVISIEEDHLPHLLQGDPHPLIHQLSEEEKEGGEEDRGKGGGTVATPERLFKVILVGNSSVGKTAFLRRFCDGHFHATTTATVGIDYSVRTLNLGNSHVALQLWDTAGQERYRSITKQFFRKADGVVVLYDVTMQSSFRSVHPWLVSIQEAVGDPIPIMLLGNKSDMESIRQVPTKEAKRLAEETNLMFYECSAYTGYNVLEAMLHLARVLREQEDRVWENTVRLVDQPVKKKSCCK
uniref:Calcium release activated channel regulator 2Ab n=1 Tax=Astyanax mexicanus TaxID=7994 RepID=A0A8B9RG20_ASTMX